MSPGSGAGSQTRQFVTEVGVSSVLPISEEQIHFALFDPLVLVLLAGAIHLDLRVHQVVL